jgi:hypothetical protein
MHKVGIYLATVIIALLLLGVIFKPPPTPTPPTKEQIEAQKAQLEQAEAKFKAEQQWRTAEQQRRIQQAQQKRALCKAADTCKKYATVRQECAVAGSFKNCISVKMNISYGTLETSCNNDGTVYTLQEVPNAILCSFLTLGGLISD